MTVESQNLIWRPMAVSDGAAMADLLNAIDAEDHVWGQYTVEDAAEELDSPVDDLPTSTLAVFDGATMLGFSAVHYKPTAEIVHRVQAAGAVRPTHRRQGLGTKLMQHGLATAEALHALHHPTLQLVVESIYGEHVHGAVALYRAAGMTATKWSPAHEASARHRHSGRPHPRRPADRGLHGRDRRGVPRGPQRGRPGRLGRSQLSAEEWKVWAVNASFRPELSFLLRDVETGTAAGVLLVVSWEAETAATGIRDAYFRVIATRPAYEERGVAEALISHTLREAQDQGYGRASLRVDADRFEQRVRSLRECRVRHPRHPGPLLHRTLTVDEEPLAGGNASGAVVRVGSTVRKPWVKSTPSVLDYMAAVRRAGVDVPIVSGRDGMGRQIIEFVPGRLAMDRDPLTHAELHRVGALVRAIHDASARYTPPDDAVWSMAIPAPAAEIVSHNDLAPWNLIIGDRWTFIDWDGSGPSTRLWDLAYAAQAFTLNDPRMDAASAARRLAALVDGYGAERELREQLPAAMHERARAMHDLLRSSHEAGLRAVGFDVRQRPRRPLGIGHRVRGTPSRSLDRSTPHLTLRGRWSSTSLVTGRMPMDVRVCDRQDAPGLRGRT